MVHLATVLGQQRDLLHRQCGDFFVQAKAEFTRVDDIEMGQLEIMERDERERKIFCVSSSR